MCRDLIGTKREAERVRAIVCTSQLYLQRFFCVQPLQEHTPHIVACACLMLAAKAEEAPLRAVSIVECLADRWPRALGAATAAPSGSAAAAASAVAAAAASGDASGTSSRAPTADPAKPDESRPNRLTALEALRRAVLEKEHCLLFALSFDVAVHLPFRWVGRALHSLSKAHPRWSDTAGGRAGMQRLSRAADVLLFDSFSTPACLTLSPKEAAVAALAVAARVALGTDMPSAFINQHSSSARCASFATDVLGAAIDAAGVHLPAPGRKAPAPSSSQSATASSAGGDAAPEAAPAPPVQASAAASGAIPPADRRAGSSEADTSTGTGTGCDDLPAPIPAPPARRPRMASDCKPESVAPTIDEA
ncbi:hypothetical protein FNF27_04624 [Cafeteria roenbergensis]|uniref:Cyclin N-terminal domain-containing protein n=1 Tax=Cafeteria roenbergensis TaxID=33653 RepID=A0A5A8EAW7_CAFRO|nr:hypothetical protein FNF27_04624 [Cafeteria roenbergensis]